MDKLTLEDVGTKMLEARDTNKVMRYEKFGVFAFRAAEPEEIITTEAGGAVETKNVAKSGDFVITGPAGEQYIIGNAKFGERYQVVSLDGSGGGMATPKPGSAEVDAFFYKGESFTFIAPWGEDMYVADGDIIATPGEKDFYRIDPKVFADTYRMKPTFQFAWAVDSKPWAVWTEGHFDLKGFAAAAERHREGIPWDAALAHAEHGYICAERSDMFGVGTPTPVTLWRWCEKEDHGAKPVTAIRWLKF